MTTDLVPHSDIQDGIAWEGIVVSDQSLPKLFSQNVTRDAASRQGQAFELTKCMSGSEVGLSEWSVLRVVKGLARAWAMRQSSSFARVGQRWSRRSSFAAEYPEILLVGDHHTCMVL